MAKVIVTETYLENIGDAIRSKLGGSDTYKPSEMAGAISQIHGDPVLDALSVTQNGTYKASDENLDGFSQVVVNVPNTYAAGDEGKVVSNGALVAQTSDTVTENDTYDTTLIDQLTVNVSGGTSIPIISAADWNAMSEVEKQSYGLIVIQTASTGFQRGYYVNGADYVDVFTVEQENAIGTGSYTYFMMGNEITLEFTGVGDFGGVVLSINDPNITQAKFDLWGNTRTVQYGTCTKSAVLPNIVWYGQGRLNYNTAASAQMNVDPVNNNLFMGIYQGGGDYKVKITLS